MSAVVTTKYTRKPFDVDAVRVTDDNMSAVAEWCGGTVVTVDEPSGKCTRRIDVPLKRIITTQRQNGAAYVGSWVLKSNDRFSVYTDRNLKGTFVPRVEVQTDSREEVIKDALEHMANRTRLIDVLEDPATLYLVTDLVKNAMRLQDIATHNGKSSPEGVMAPVTATDIINELKTRVQNS